MNINLYVIKLYILIRILINNGWFAFCLSGCLSHIIKILTFSAERGCFNPPYSDVWAKFSLNFRVFEWVLRIFTIFPRKHLKFRIVDKFWGPYHEIWRNGGHLDFLPFLTRQNTVIWVFSTNGAKKSPKMLQYSLLRDQMKAKTYGYQYRVG